MILKTDHPKKMSYVGEFLLENAKKKLVFHFGGGRHASFPQKPVVKSRVHVQDKLTFVIVFVCSRRGRVK